MSQADDDHATKTTTDHENYTITVESISNREDGQSRGKSPDFDPVQAFFEDIIRLHNKYLSDSNDDENPVAAISLVDTTNCPEIAAE